LGRRAMSAVTAALASRKKKKNGKAIEPANVSKPPARKRGRPKEGIDTLPTGWQQQIISLYAEGADDVEVKAQIYVWRGSFSNNLWDRWLTEEQEFSETVKKGRELSFAWWSAHLRKQSVEGKGNVTATIFAMKNRFPEHYKDRHEVAGVVKHTHQHRAVSELNARTAELIDVGSNRADKTLLPN